MRKSRQVLQTRPGNEDAVAVQCSSADNEAVISRLLGELGCKWAGPGWPVKYKKLLSGPELHFSDV